MKDRNTRIRAAWSDLGTERSQVVPRFYSRLFGLCPDLRAQSPDRFETMLYYTKVFMERWVNQVGDPTAIAELAKTFREINPTIATDDYVFVGEALVYALCISTDRSRSPVAWQDTRDDWLESVGELIHAIEESDEGGSKKEEPDFSHLSPSDFAEILDAIQDAASRAKTPVQRLGLHSFKTDLKDIREAIEKAERSAYFDVDGPLDAKTVSHRLAVNSLRARLNEILATL